MAVIQCGQALLRVHITGRKFIAQLFQCGAGHGKPLGHGIAADEGNGGGDPFVRGVNVPAEGVALFQPQRLGSRLSQCHHIVIGGNLLAAGVGDKVAAAAVCDGCRGGLFDAVGLNFYS